jgi:peptide/nickel transport system permease protein
VFGTDHLGRDLLTRLLYASRVSLFTALSAASIASIVGISIGLVAGYFGGRTDNLLMRCTELVAVFPSFVLIAILSHILVRNEQIGILPIWLIEPFGRLLSISPREARGVLLIILLLAVFSWPSTARLARGMALSIREQPYIESVRALGGGHAFMIRRHVFPNALPPLIVDFTLAVNVMLLTESGLSFLSFGIQEPTPTWGNMLAFAQSYMFQHPWLPLVPALPILICSLAINYLGDGLRDALDPRQRH